MSSHRPNFIILGGPNGAGKSTVASALLRDELAFKEFVNADVIAQGLSGFAAEGAAIAAGRIMLRRIEQLIDTRVQFAFESTLASRTLLGVVQRAREGGFSFGLVFLWLPNEDAAVRRVRQRVEQGGHAIPEVTIRRRYHRGLENFFRLYRPLADEWRFYDNSTQEGPRLIARGAVGAEDEVIDAGSWGRARSRS